MGNRGDSAPPSTEAPVPRSRVGLRWGYLVPRLIILGLALFLLEWGGGWLIGRFVLRLVDRVPGVSVAAERLHVGLLTGRYAAEDVRVALAQQAEEHGMTAKRIELRVDPRQLSRKKLVVTHAHLDGVRFEARQSQDDDSIMSSSAVDAARRTVARAQSAARRAMDEWTGAWRSRVDSLTESLETAREAQRIEAAWRLRFDRWRESAAKWERQLSRIERVWREARNATPAEQVVRLAPLVPEIQRLMAEWQEARREVGRLDEIWNQDRQALEEAKTRDLKRIEELSGVKSFDARAVARGLIGTDTLEKLEQARRWIGRFDRVRQWVAFKPPANRLGRRGRDISFDRSGIPGFWIRQLTLNGSFGPSRRSVPFRAVLLDVSTAPELLPRPARCVARAAGEAPCRVEWICDARSSEEPRQNLSVTFDPWELAGTERRIGDDIAWRMAAGRAQAWFWSSHGAGETRSRLRLQFTEVRSTVELPQAGWEWLGERPIEFSPERPISVEVEWTGTRIPNDLALRSNLGELLQRPFEQVVNRAIERQRAGVAEEIETRRRAVAARIDREIDARLDRIEQWGGVLEPIYRRLKLDPAAALGGWRLWR